MFLFSGDFVAVLFALAGIATSQRYALYHAVNSTNFFDEFHLSTPEPSALNGEHVEYQSVFDAYFQGIVEIRNNEIYLGVDHNTILKGAFHAGRRSFRAESRTTFKRGLVIVRFTHMPKLVCGSWSALWTLGVGKKWPEAGEIDMYEGWNEQAFNKPAFHVDSASAVGECINRGRQQTASVADAWNCDNYFNVPGLQSAGEGCVSTEAVDGIWGSANGGTQALVWTSRSINIFTWPRGREPVDVGSATPDTATWGTPSVHLDANQCDIDRAFAAQKLILNIAFCGNPAGSDVQWGEVRGASGVSCRDKTGAPTCVDFVSKHPEAFRETYFTVRDVRYFAEKEE